MVVQVGLYLRNNGFNNNIYNDLEAYIKGKKVDLIVFSENVFFGHKNDYIKKITDIFINNLKDILRISVRIHLTYNTYKCIIILKDDIKHLFV